MTLIVAAEDEADAQSASETLAELMHEHPSRAIVLKPSSSGELGARVFAQCWMPFGGRQQICCEQIEIAASPDRLGDVPGIMLGLLAPDLPVVLWCRGERWFAEPHFGQLLPLVDKLIVDSTSFADAGSAFTLIAELMHGGHRIADLTWARLTGWREVIAHAFDSAQGAAAVDQIRTIRVGYAGARALAAALHMAGWLQHLLPRATPALALESGAAGDGHGIRSVNLGPVSFKAVDGSVIEVRFAGALNTAVLPPSNDCEAMRQELSITGRDVLFEQAHRIASELAETHK